MKYDPISRRFFLQGVGGSLMALPILPSLLPRAEAAVGPAKIFVTVGTGHGGAPTNDWYPAPVATTLSSPLLTQTQMYASGENGYPHIIRHGQLKNMLTAGPGHDGGDVDSGNARLSYILGSFLNPYVEKMNFYRGIDGSMAYYGHSKGIYGGNIWAGAWDPKLVWPTLDQFVARSSLFYPDRRIVSVPVISFGGMSWLPTGKTSPTTAESVAGLYKAIFEKFDPNLSAAAVTLRARRQFLIDRVYSDYKRLTTGISGPARRLSSVDKTGLEEHVQSLRDLEDKYSSVINECSQITGPNSGEVLGYNGDQGVYERAWDFATDLLVAGFHCGANRIATLSAAGLAGAWKGDYHQDIAHNESDRSKQLVHVKSLRWTAQHVVGSVVRKMHARKGGDGQSLLDHALVVWIHEAGVNTHSQVSIGLTTFGSLGGFFKTGNYVDYRNMDNLGLNKNYGLNLSRPGIPANRFWANILLGLGFTPAEFERFGRKGYGDTSVNPHATANKTHNAYPAEILNSLSDKLPIVT